jgi:hypothetical protein
MVESETCGDPQHANLIFGTTPILWTMLEAIR